MSNDASVHDHGNCELCDRLEAETRSQRFATATRIRAIAESLVTQEPRRDCVTSLVKLATDLEADE